MKKSLPSPAALTLILTLFSFNLLAQDFEWAFTASKQSISHAIAIRKDNADNFYLATRRDSAGIELNSEIEKRDALQNLEWNKIFAGDAIISDVELNVSQNAIVVGYYMNSLTIDGTTIQSGIFSYSGFICEFDQNGVLQWLKNINPVNDDFRPHDLFIGVNSMYLTSELNGLTDDFTAFHRLDFQGNILQSEFNHNTEARTYTNIIADADGNVYLSGTCGNMAQFDTISANNSFSYQNFVMKYDSSFHALWFHSREYITFDHNNSLQMNGTNLFWAFDDFTFQSDTMKIIKLDVNGAIVTEIPGPIPQSFFPTIQLNMDSEGNSVLGFEVFSRLFLYRYDPSFNVIWHDTLLTGVSGFPGNTDIRCYDSTIYIAGLYYTDTMQVGNFSLVNPNQTSNWPADVFVCKWNQSVITGVRDSEISETALTVYPNPVSDKISFNADLPGEKFTIRIYDSMGKKVYENTQQLRVIDVSSFNSGLYYLEVTNGKQMFRNRFIKQN